MPSALKAYSEVKRTGKVYTPEDLVEAVLDSVGYVAGSQLLAPSTRILDPACGDGQFLIGIVRRILAFLPPSTWERALHNIEGWDIDKNALHACKERLDAEVAPHGLSIAWRLRHCDSLMAYCNLLEPIPLYDLVVGNPPYIRIQHLPDSYKRFLQENFSFCQKGSTDIYLAFFELGISLLSSQGKLAFITPNSWLYTTAARPFREALRRQRLLERVIDYDTSLPFEGIGAYVSITVLSKEPHHTWRYERRSHPPVTLHLPVQTYPAEVQCPPSRAKRSVPLGQIAHIGVGITTLADKVFILQGDPSLPLNKPIVRLQTSAGETVEIESALLRPIIKASTFKGDTGHPKEYIIFPYELLEGRFRILSEEVLQALYPLGYAYLLRYRFYLLRRDGGKPNPEGWYAFGRHQNLETSFGTKIIFPPLSNTPQFSLSRLEACTVYSGYFIKYNGDYEVLLAQLNSPRMAEYIQYHSRPFRGGWRAYNKRVLEGFPIELP